MDRICLTLSLIFLQACGINGREGTVELAEELFCAMQQRTNHFSTYIAPTELHYQRLMSGGLIDRIPQFTISPILNDSK